MYRPYFYLLHPALYNSLFVFILKYTHHIRCVITYISFRCAILFINDIEMIFTMIWCNEETMIMMTMTSILIYQTWVILLSLHSLTQNNYILCFLFVYSLNFLILFVFVTSYEFIEQNIIIFVWEPQFKFRIC